MLLQVIIILAAHTIIPFVSCVEFVPAVQKMVNSLTQEDLEPVIRDWTGMQSCIINGSMYTFQGRSAYNPDQSYHSTHYCILMRDWHPTGTPRPLQPQLANLFDSRPIPVREELCQQVEMSLLKLLVA